MDSIATLRPSLSLTPLQLLTTGALLIALLAAMLYIPTQLNLSLLGSEVAAPVLTPITQLETQAEIAVATPIANLFFGNVASTQMAADLISGEETYVESRDAYSASLAIIEKYGAAIEAEATRQSVPADVAIGVAFLENGGSATAKSPAGAVGIYQLMPATARSLGLTVTKKVDDRLSPEKSIEAGLSYLKQNFERFGDWGLATWAYHAGEGNVTKALQIYAKANDGIKLPGVEDSATLKAYVESHHLTIFALLSDPSVKTFAQKLNDDSIGYPYKVAATATLYTAANQG